MLSPRRLQDRVILEAFKPFTIALSQQETKNRGEKDSESISDISELTVKLEKWGGWRERDRTDTACLPNFYKVQKGNRSGSYKSYFWSERIIIMVLLHHVQDRPSRDCRFWEEVETLNVKFKHWTRVWKSEGKMDWNFTSASTFHFLLIRLIL